MLIILSESFTNYSPPSILIRRERARTEGTVLTPKLKNFNYTLAQEVIFCAFLLFFQIKKMTYRTCKPPSQSVHSGVCHRLALMSKITIRLTISRPLIYTIILTNMSYKRKRKTYFGFIHYKKHTLSSD